MNPKYVKAETILNKIQELEEERQQCDDMMDIIYIDKKITVLKEILKPQ